MPTQRTRPRQTREQTRRQILDAALDQLREAPYRELTIEVLMTRTGHTRTVFYRHFSDIPAVVLTLIQEVGGELVEVAAEWAQTDRVSPVEARSQLARFVDFYVRNGPLVHAVSEASHHDAQVEQAYTAMVDGFILVTEQAIRRRIDDGDLAPLDAPEIARALVRMLNGYLEDALGRDRDVDPERVLDAVATIWTRTLFP